MNIREDSGEECQWILLLQQEILLLSLYTFLVKDFKALILLMNTDKVEVQVNASKTTYDCVR